MLHPTEPPAGAAILFFINGTKGQFVLNSLFSGLAESETRRTTEKGGWGCGTVLRQPGGGDRSLLWAEALAIGPAHGNTMRLSVAKAGARANRARPDKERTSERVDTSAHHLWKITKSEGAVPMRT